MAAAAGAGQTPSAQTATRDLYELRRYRLRVGAQRDAARSYFRDALVPALGRLGLGPVGVFDAFVGEGPLAVVLFRHPSADSVVSLGGRLLGDAAYRSAGAPFLTAPAERPLFERIESSLLRAFESFPTLVVPDTSAPRLFELRRYEGPTDTASLKKIEMFDSGGELPIFRKVGFRPVFFGQTVVGARMPNFEYMLAFTDMAEREAAWGRFRTDPEWKVLSQHPEYQDARIMSNNMTLFLTPQPSSQI
jgi:hypothetical protein